MHILQLNDSLIGALLALSVVAGIARFIEKDPPGLAQGVTHSGWHSQICKLLNYSF